MALTNKIIKILNSNSELRMKIAIADKKSELTVRRWAKENHDSLTKDIVLETISKELGLSRSEILTKKKTV